MAQVGAVPPPRLDRRVVYLEDEFDDSGDEDDFDFGFLNDKMDNLPALCSNNCGEAALATAYSEADNITTGLCSRAGPTCNVDTVQDLAKATYAPPAPYEMASSMTHNFHKKERKTPERYNYAKALLASEEELERLARKIRSEIRQEEILELALEAERAAEAGEERFTGRASTFGSDEAPTGLKNSPEGRGSKSYSRNRTSEGIGRKRNSTRIGVLALRDAGEVIPDFNELHAHMRTHLARQNVNKNTLLFREKEPEDGTSEKQQQELLEDESTAEHLAHRSMLFLENIADLSMQHMSAQGMYHSYHNCGRSNPALAEMVDDTSLSSAASSKSDRFGRTLSDHISPVKGADLRRPRVKPLPGLSATEEIEASLSLPKRLQNTGSHTRTLSPPEGNTRSLALPELTPKPRTYHQRQSSSDDEQNGDGTADTEDTSSSSGSFPATPEKKEPENDFSTSLYSPDSALFDAHHSDGKSESPCPPSPIGLTQGEEAVPTSPETPKTTTISRMSRFERRRRKSDPRFATPTGLRDIRGSRSKSGAASPLNVLVLPDISTPEINPTMAFEPSSIIDSGSGSSRQVTVVIKTEQAMFLALPSIQNVPNERYFRAQRLSPKQREEKRNLLRPRQRPNPEGSMNTSELTNLISMQVPIPEGDDEHSAYSYSAHHRARTDPQPEMESEASPHTDAWWDAKEKATPPDNQAYISSYRNIVDQRQDDALDQPILSKVNNGEQDPLSSSNHSNNEEQGPLSSSNHSKPDTANDLEEGPSEVPEETQVSAEETKQEDRSHTAEGVENFEQSESKTQAETIAVGVCERSQSLDVTPGMSCSCECNVSVSSAEDLTHPPLYTPSGEDLKQQPLHPSVTWGGHCSQGTPDIKRGLSWPGVGAAAEPAIAVIHDLADPDKEHMYPDPDTVCSHISSAAKKAMNTSGATNEGPTYLASTSFQTTVGDVISRFTPTCQERLETSIFYPESENSEFLNNYFYCSKNEDGEVPLSHQPQSAADRYACAEPCEGVDQFDNCHVGEAIRGGFEFLFRPNRVVHRSSSTPTLKPVMKERALSVGRIDDSEVHSRRWFGVIDMSSSRFFPFPNSGKDEAGKLAYQCQLQPPCLKKSSSCGQSRIPSRPAQRHNRAKTSLISDSSFDKYVRSQQFPEGATSESQFQALCGMSRDAFLSLPKKDRVRVAEKVETNFPHLQRKEPLIPSDSVDSGLPASPRLSRRTRQAALMESLDLSAIRLEDMMDYNR